MGLEDIDIGQDETLWYERPELPPLEDVARYYALAEETRVYSGGGPCRQRLATRLAAQVGAAGCVPVANGTVGLMVALREACGSRRAGRGLVVVQSFAPAATACAIVWAGFEPLFVDVDTSTWQLDGAALADALDRFGPSCAGILAGSTCGSAPPAELREIWRELARAHHLPLVIDSAAAFGACDDLGRLSGGCGDVEVFSFQASRPFAIGEGGAIMTPDPEQANRLETLTGLGISPESGTCAVPGLNAGMSELSAAVGLAMFDRYEDALSRRRSTATQLQAVFDAYPIRYQIGSASSTWPAFHVRLPDSSRRDHLLRMAERLRIEVRTGHSPPLHEQPAFLRSARAERLDATEELSRQVLALPLANSLGPRQVVRLAELLELAFDGRPA